MAMDIVIPRLGWSMDEGVFVGWLKQDGETVRAGEPLFSLEGEKATQDVEAIDEGTLRIPADGPNAGDVLLVGAVIGYMLGPGEAEPTARKPQVDVVKATPSPAVAVAAQSNSARESDRPRSSPLARRVARDLGVDWTRLQGSGRTGRVRKADVLESARARDARPPAVVHTNGDATPARSVAVSPTRRTIAARMVESQRTTAPVTLTTSLDATNLVSLRGQFKATAAEGADVPSFTDFVVKLVALALREHPLLNARWADGDDRIVTSDVANVGIAVDTEAGLLVPVIHDAASLGLRQIAARSRELIGKARGQRLRPGDFQGGTFTVTNLGAFGVETFTPIINPPECAVLGMGRLETRPVMDGDRVVGQARMGLSLTFDHRIVDGAPAARFLQHLVRLIENPGPSLMS